MATALLNSLGQVITFVTSPVPEGYHPPEGCTIIDESALPNGWVRVPMMREESLAARDAAFNQTLSTGYADATLGITVAITDGDRQQFDALATHLARKGAAATDTVTIAALDRTPHTLTVEQFNALLVRAGDYYLALWTKKLQDEAALK